MSATLRRHMIAKSSLPHNLCQFYTRLLPASVPIKRRLLAPGSYVPHANNIRSVFTRDCVLAIVSPPFLSPSPTMKQ
jgi:hypothetical protein